MIIGRQQIDNGYYYITCRNGGYNNQNRMFLRNFPGSRRIQITSNKQLATRWHLARPPYYGGFTIKTTFDLRAMEVPGGSTAEGLKIEVGPSKSENYQKWYINYIGYVNITGPEGMRGYRGGSMDLFHISSVATGKILEVKAHLYVEGGDVQQSTTSWNDSAKWGLVGPLDIV